MTTVLAFNKWDCSHIKVIDPGLERYINVNPVFVPRTGARYAGNRFHKSRSFIVERLINRMMIPGHRGKKHKLTSGFCTGKSSTVYNLVEKAFTIIEQKTKKNPIEVFVKALENAAPREEIVAIEYGGARYPKAVECAPQRRIDFVLKMMTQGAYQKTFSSKKKAEECLADEIMAAYNLSQNSAAIAKKLELERQADASK
ncbi:MAG: 30S ribosomal protein S7 [Nanoarchaeota archaeon]|nr:30S ribosomal protein S7 [Nanoarchaeota archaeon]MBU1269816.1 30S ribosomal protein S7 [Nanoarchaeota archaeon]MBU1604871.1 30S ribosomal protein S7 [Nanoarchaeota archaeon]MBU2442573.1 30S ribosomal protein S7 [Nanoarchaeota archaeon]